jgi:hypothetical protein
MIIHIPRFLKKKREPINIFFENKYYVERMKQEIEWNNSIKQETTSLFQRALQYLNYTLNSPLSWEEKCINLEKPCIKWSENSNDLVGFGNVICCNNEPFISVERYVVK